MKLSEMKSALPPPKILLGGLPGVGKTALAATYGEGMQFLGVDNALATCRTLKDSFTTQRMSIDFIDCIESDPTRVASTHQKIKSHLIDLLNRSRQKDASVPKALCIDGLTFAVKAAFDYIMYNSGKLARIAPGVPDIKALLAQNASMPEWGLMISEVVQIFQLIRALPLTVIVTCHYEQVLTPMGGMRYDLAIPTKELPRQIPGMVDEVWFMESQLQPAGAPMKRVLRTMSSPLMTCRSNYNLLDGIDTAIGMREILKKMGVEV